MYPSFREFMTRKNQDVTDDVLVQALAVITTTPPYDTWTPDEVWDHLVTQTKVVKGEVRG